MILPEEIINIDNSIIIHDIKMGMPGISPAVGTQLYEAFMVCMIRLNHISTTKLSLAGEKEMTLSLHWDNYYNDQIDNSWKDQEYCTDHAAVCLSALLVKECTEYTIIQRSRKGTGIDYWLGKDTESPFMNSARLEVSGIFRESKTNTLDGRLKIKKKQSTASEYTKLPAYISIVEFSKPKAIFVKK